MCDPDFASVVGVGGSKIDIASFCGKKIGGTDYSVCDKSRDGGVSLEDRIRPSKVGLGGGNETSKGGVGRKSGGLGEEYNDPDVGKLRRS